MSAPIELELLNQVFAVTRQNPGTCHPEILGEIQICMDSDETAWITPSPRLDVTDELLDRIADVLRPLGIVWMRGWGYGGRQGRIITANGPLTVLPPREYPFDSGPD